MEPRVDVGSSPLARGTLRSAVDASHGMRFIPARAGNTARCACCAATRPVHPRSRGEHGDGLAHGLLGRRFIPARAGNTPRSLGRRQFWSVHPRSRGEHSAPTAAAARMAGSSPLARGTPSARADRRRVMRFIPARAGNTCVGMRSCAFRPVHPRSRGEHGAGYHLYPYDDGSSPLARGTL